MRNGVALARSLLVTRKSTNEQLNNIGNSRQEKRNTSGNNGYYCASSSNLVNLTSERCYSSTSDTRYCQYKGRPLQGSHVLNGIASSSSTALGVITKEIPVDNPCNFGLLLDIDGVICRGKDILPGVQEAFRLLTGDDGTFKVPTVFVTNASNSLRALKAERLTDSVGVSVDPRQVVMAHSPLKMFTELHDKHVLVVGQGPLKEIATMLGFTRVTRLDDLRVIFPHLDTVDFKRRKFEPYTPVQESFPQIEVVLLFGEPLHWETALQLIIDVLITNGKPGSLEIKRGVLPYPHVPVLACNMDLLWMAEKIPLPRFGHGTFLTCLETLYHKLTGYNLEYTAVMGKPSVITYIHAAHCIQQESKRLGIQTPEVLYAIGDNPESDILGANLFDRYLREGEAGRLTSLLADLDVSHFEDNSDPEHMSVHNLSRCFSVLVETGVYSRNCRMNGIVQPVGNLYDHLDKELHQSLREPTFVEEDFCNAIRMILNKQLWNPRM